MTKDQAILVVAQEYFHLSTLERKGINCGDDYHESHVDDIRAALEAAYEAGVAQTMFELRQAANQIIRDNKADIDPDKVMY